MNNIYTKIVSQIKKYFTDAGFKKAVLGVSGGIDSALTLKLLVDALGPKNVTAILMPEHGITKSENISHSKALCKFLEVNFFMIPINKYLLDFLQLPWRPNHVAQMNTKARIRAVILYNFANTENALVVGTSNKSELKLGYGTKFGDLAADLLPIGDLYKTEVYSLAEHVGLPDEIIKKAPSAELYHGQTDEKELGAPYNKIDEILKSFDIAMTTTQTIAPSSELEDSIAKRMSKNKHKLQTPYIIKL